MNKLFKFFISTSFYQRLIQKEKWRKYFKGKFYLITDGDFAYWSEDPTHCGLSRIAETNFYK